MKTVIGVVVAALACAGFVVAGDHPEHPTSKAPAAAEGTAVSAGVLDGKVFAGEIGKKGETKGDKDDFVFKGGKFVSTVCVAYGFNEAPYVATEKDGVVTFKAEPVNAKGEKMKWDGTIKGREISGTAVYDTGTSQVEHWFKGTLKPQGASDKAEPPKKHEHPEHPK